MTRSPDRSVYKTQIILRQHQLPHAAPGRRGEAGSPSTPDADDYVDQGVSDDVDSVLTGYKLSRIS